VDLAVFTRELRVQGTEPPPVRGVLHKVDAVFAQNRVRKIPQTQKCLRWSPRELVFRAMIPVAVDLDENGENPDVLIDSDIFSLRHLSSDRQGKYTG
jgi:hypothetical protein